MRVRSAKERLTEFDSQVKTYTEEQFGVLESIQLNDTRLVAFPTTAFDQWLVKFENRFKADPLFLSKGLD